MNNKHFQKYILFKVVAILIMKKFISSLVFIRFWSMFQLNAQGIFISPDSDHIPVNTQQIDKFTLLDTAKFIITYEVSIINNPKDPKQIEKDIQVLQIGNKYSKSYSKLLFEGDSISQSYFKKGARNAQQMKMSGIELFLTGENENAENVSLPYNPIELE